MINTSNVARTQFLSFALAGEEYAVDILRAKEIIEYDNHAEHDHTAELHRDGRDRGRRRRHSVGNHH